MYIQVVTYALGGMPESEYLDLANDLAPSFSGLPGLQAKIWLEDPNLGRYGAVYFWEDLESMDRFLRSDLFEGTNPEFVDVESEGFTILENLTAQTQPVLELVQGRRRAAPATRPATPAPRNASSAARSGSGTKAREIAAKTGPASGGASPTKTASRRTTAKAATKKAGG